MRDAIEGWLAKSAANAGLFRIPKAETADGSPSLGRPLSSA